MGFWTVSPPLLYIQCGFRPNDDPDVFRSIETKDLTVTSLIETYLKVKAENERLLFTQKAVIQCGLSDVRAVSYVRENIIRSSRLDLERLESHWGWLGCLDLECFLFFVEVLRPHRHCIDHLGGGLRPCLSGPTRAVRDSNVPAEKSRKIRPTRASNPRLLRATAKRLAVAPQTPVTYMYR